MGLMDELDDPLVHAVQDGVTALPADIDQLSSYMRIIQDLFGEKAVAQEPTFALACANAAELEALQNIERAVVKQAIALRLDTLEAVLMKLAIWRTLVEDEPGGLRDRLVLSVESDLRAIALHARRRN